MTRQGFEPWRFAPEQLNHLPDGQDKLDYQLLVFYPRLGHFTHVPRLNRSAILPF
jgi:hypothetical protein